MFRALRQVFPAGGVQQGQNVILRPPVAITSTLDPEDAAELEDVELKVRPEAVFSTTVGPPAKKTLAQWHVTAPEEVVEAMETLLEK